MCIVGAGHAGYGALVAAQRTPERYRCAAALNAVADLAEHYHERRLFACGTAALEAELGHA